MARGRRRRRRIVSWPKDTWAAALMVQALLYWNAADPVYSAVFFDYGTVESQIEGG